MTLFKKKPPSAWIRILPLSSTSLLSYPNISLPPSLIYCFHLCNVKSWWQTNIQSSPCLYTTASAQPISINCHIQARTPTFLAKLIAILVIHFPEQVHVPTVMRPNPLYFHILYHSYIEAGFSHQMSHRNKAKIAPKS